MTVRVTVLAVGIAGTGVGNADAQVSMMPSPSADPGAGSTPLFMIGGRIGLPVSIVLQRDLLIKLLHKHLSASQARPTRPLERISGLRVPFDNSRSVASL
jgi:hypothetical protein